MVQAMQIQYNSSKNVIVPTHSVTKLYVLNPML